MKNDRKEQLLRLMDDTLTPTEETTLRREIQACPALRAELDELSSLRSLLTETVSADAETALRPFFSERLIRRLRPVEPVAEADLVSLLATLFRPIAVASLIIIVALFTYNILTVSYAADQSATEKVLGLPPVTLATAYDLNLETP